MVRFTVAALVVLSLPAFAQYNRGAGYNAPEAKAAAEPSTERGRRDSSPTPAPRDEYGNARGSEYDLAVDGAFDGQTILIVDQYHHVYSLDVSPVVTALEKKGFNVVRYNGVPSVAELERGLSKSNQFWVISNCNDTTGLTAEHRALVKEFFDAGHGVYLWGDNDPCNADANTLGKMLVDASVTGDLPGDQNVTISRKPGQPGVVRDHLLSTGVEIVYEGVTVATVKPAGNMTPIIYGSAGNLITAAYEKSGKRLLIDGGFTRLQYKFNSAGTGRYITNAAAWLANYERFGDQVVAQQFKKQTPKP